MEITQGNISLDDANRLQAASFCPNPAWHTGDTEPWVIQVVASLVLASGANRVVELGGYSGACSVILAAALTRLGGGELIVMEHLPQHVDEIRSRLASVPPEVKCEVWHCDVMDGIAELADGSVNFAWVDDDHEGPHVVEETHRLIPKMADNGIICFHDVCGLYGLHYVVRHYQGLALNLPRVSVGGGLGIVQVRPRTRQIPKMTITFPPKKDPTDRIIIGPDKEP